MKAELSQDKKHLVITLELTKPTLSPTGKTLSVGSSHGNQPTAVIIDGKPVKVGVNAFIQA